MTACILVCQFEIELFSNKTFQACSTLLVNQPSSGKLTTKLSADDLLGLSI